MEDPVLADYTSSMNTMPPIAEMERAYLERDASYGETRSYEHIATAIENRKRFARWAMRTD